MRLARELDYTPAAAARSLVTQRSHVIGVFLETGDGHPDLQHPFFHEVLVGLKQRVGAARLRPAAVRLRAPRQRLRRALLPQARAPPQRRRRRADGRRPRGPRGPPAGARRVCRRRRRRRARRARATEFVMSDNEAGAAVAVRHLHELGHRRIATITGLLETRPGADRLRGYRAALQARGPRLPRRVRRLRRLLRRERARGDGAPARPRRAADGDRRGLGHDGPRRDPRRRRGRPAVPEDLSVVGFDDIQLAGHVNPPLTTLRQDKARLGAAAGDALVAADRRRSRPRPDAMTLPVELVVRGSTAAAGG